MVFERYPVDPAALGFGNRQPPSPPKLTTRPDRLFQVNAWAGRKVGPFFMSSVPPGRAEPLSSSPSPT